ncbi:MAG: Transcription factor Sox-2 [Peltula sp. TS41687]|nr:MAG: Transcription factor Sox-2 [Peltula sp. TS41687]
MATSSVQMAYVSKLQHPILLEQVWQVALSQFAQGVFEVILPTNMKGLLGDEGISIIAQRYSALIRAPAVVFVDTAIDAIRMVPPMPPVGALQVRRPHANVLNTPSNGVPSLASTTGAFTNGTSTITDVKTIKKTQLESGKVPRPPNAFILYRQQHHPLLKNASPRMHNNEISIILGNQWKAEDEATKLRYRDMARALKEQHGKDHPQYQYQPRKPSEKKRRMARGKVAGTGNSSGLDSPTDASSAGQGELMASALTEQPGTLTTTPNPNAATQTEGSDVTVPAPSDMSEVVSPNFVDENTNLGSFGDLTGMAERPNWIEEDMDLFSLDLGAPQNDMADRLEGFNELLAAPRPHDLDFDIPSPAITAMPNVETELDDEQFKGITEWEHFQRLLDTEVDEDLERLGWAT